MIPARCGMAVRMRTGDVPTVINPVGFQICGHWVIKAADLNECSSTEHLHAALLSIAPKMGNGIASNLRRTMMTITVDTSPRVQ